MWRLTERDIFGGSILFRSVGRLTLSGPNPVR